MPKRSDTREKILQLSQELVQQRGFNGFSYQDIADALGVRKASLHYHFPSKADLGEHLIARYREAFFTELLPPTGGNPAPALAQFFTIFQDVTSSGSPACLAGVMCAEYGTLPQPMQRALQVFFRDAEGWLGVVLAKGRKAGTFAFEGSARTRAEVLMATLEGALLTGRVRDPQARLAHAIEHIQADLTPN